MLSTRDLLMNWSLLGVSLWTLITTDIRVLPLVFGVFSIWYLIDHYKEKGRA